MLNKQKRWDKRYLSLAVEVGKWTSCIRDNRKVGAIIVKNGRIIATGYNGAPSNITNCIERGYCLRNSLDINHGEQQQICYSVHAEQNAILQAAKFGISVDNSTLYCTHSPCSICAKMIINSGIKRIVYLNDYPDDFAKQLLSEANIILEKLDE